jgi:hypothetical protein
MAVVIIVAAFNHLPTHFFFSFAHLNASPTHVSNCFKNCIRSEEKDDKDFFVFFSPHPV